MAGSTDFFKVDCRKRQVYYTAWLLRQLLVPELIPSILEYARYFRHQASTSNRYVVVRPSNSPSTLLISDEIGLVRRPKAIRVVSFDIISKDQGYVAFPGWGEWTWFTAGMIKSDESKIVQEREIFRNDPHDNGFIDHRIEWLADSNDREEAEWVNSLRSGDRVVIRGHSKYHGWINFVNFVQVTVSTRVVR